jgi:hypothetical protein
MDHPFTVIGPSSVRIVPVLWPHVYWTCRRFPPASAMDVKSKQKALEHQLYSLDQSVHCVLRANRLLIVFKVSWITTIICIYLIYTLQWPTTYIDMQYNTICELTFHFYIYSVHVIQLSWFIQPTYDFFLFKTTLVNVQHMFYIRQTISRQSANIQQTFSKHSANIKNTSEVIINYTS